RLPCPSGSRAAGLRDFHFAFRLPSASFGPPSSGHFQALHFLKSSPGSSGGPPYSLKLKPLLASVTSPGICAPSVRSRTRIAPSTEYFPPNSCFFPPCWKPQVNFESGVRLSENDAPSLRFALHLPTIFEASMSAGAVGSASAAAEASGGCGVGSPP